MRGVVVVIDSFGIGAAPDAGAYGDAGANTMRSVCLSTEAGTPAPWPNLRAMGLGNCGALVSGLPASFPQAENPSASCGAMAPKSSGKDTTTGHWELAGIVMKQGFHVFQPHYPAFPEELVRRFESETGFTLLGNRAASGTAIIEELGEEQMKGGSVICYTSADSVFQIAAHDAVVPVETLYRICEISRSICDDFNVARVIARPFTGVPGAFTRTAGRRDFSIALPGPTLLDWLVERGVETVGIGKIGDIFNGQGLSVSYPDKGNRTCLERLVDTLGRAHSADQLVFVNLVDTDMIYGHRRDPDGYCRAVAEIDAWLPRICERLADQDFLIITADHGCDPCFQGSDHTREYAPLLLYSPGKTGRNLGVFDSLSAVSTLVAGQFRGDESVGFDVLSA